MKGKIKIICPEEFEPYVLKQDIIEAWKKNRLPLFIKSISKEFNKVYDRYNNESYIIAIIKDYLIEIEYSKEFIHGYISKYARSDIPIWFIKPIEDIMEFEEVKRRNP